MIDYIYGLMDTNIQRVLMFVWVLLFRKLIAIGIYSHRVLVIDRYLYSWVCEKQYLDMPFILPYVANTQH